MTDIINAFSARLRELDVPGEVVEFAEPVPTAAAAAERLGCTAAAIANSLVFAVDDEPLLVIASGAHRVDTAHVARELGIGWIRRATPEFVLDATGQPVGGVGPVGHPRRIRTVVDRALAEHPTVWAGAGSEHAMFPSTFAELLRITGGTPLLVAGPADRA
ncbi:YbaK/EbsC family protein [Saccharopolyspora gloriosae]|uniref:Prolyl-tRNA editing enzyme YbaK/EbsC (Cys-tRNA(Pro) deacylase) n=1 Tax=Saccharopolyspora gloriosae TaxID=455344 RepID=A0A840NMT6_9PSEU|nr:YbaK/EbsC family protein [Saccharopolyspora gloriosae]MBB5072411.1 prolyl-tRNA editing enzyme YbaK/EbsC (Cys-tRNA(Pro) deacylase) [Saccharopolyspora gloriosae]